MTELTSYHASDRRVYNGAPCSDMRREWQYTDDLVERMQKAERTASTCYFPMEGTYLVFTNSKGALSDDEYFALEGPPQILTGNFHEDKQLALIEAIEILEGGN